VCGNKNRPLFELPGEFEQRNKWLEIIGEFCGNFSKTPTNLYIIGSTIFIIFYTDISNITDHSVCMSIIIQKSFDFFQTFRITDVCSF
jgi:hypothetical protein